MMNIRPEDEPAYRRKQIAFHKSEMEGHQRALNDLEEREKQIAAKARQEARMNVIKHRAEDAIYDMNCEEAITFLKYTYGVIKTEFNIDI